MGRAGGDAWNQISGGDRAADAAEAAASAQRDQAAAAYRRTNQMLTPALNDYSSRLRSSTVAGLNAADADLANQERNLARQEKLLASIDPTIMEASQQALKLLRGEESSTLSPLKRQRDLQRQKLLNQLREQLGPGAETSTAGIQALTRFDAETSNLMGGAQQQALGNLGQISGQFSAQRPDMLREIAGYSNFGQQRSATLGRQAEGELSANMNVANLLSGARQPLIQSAGAQYTGALLRGQKQQAFTGDILKAGLTAGVSAVGDYTAGKWNPQAATK